MQQGGTSWSTHNRCDIKVWHQLIPSANCPWCLPVCILRHYVHSTTTSAAADQPMCVATHTSRTLNPLCILVCNHCVGHVLQCDIAHAVHRNTVTCGFRTRCVPFLPSPPFAQDTSVSVLQQELVSVVDGRPAPVDPQVAKRRAIRKGAR
jgi:hypothetical protein